MEGKLKISFIGDSHIAYWPFESYFPKWECYNYGVPGKGLDYVEMFHKDVSDSYVVVQLGTNDIYNLNTENMDVYVAVCNTHHNGRKRIQHITRFPCLLCHFSPSVCLYVIAAAHLCGFHQWRNQLFLT